MWEKVKVLSKLFDNSKVLQNIFDFEAYYTLDMIT